MQKFLAPKYVYKFQNCACLLPLCPASLFLDSCRLIGCLWTQKHEKGPRETARSWARNVFEAEGEEIYRAKRKGQTCHYTWNKVCSHLRGEQESCFSPSCGWTWEIPIREVGKVMHHESRSLAVSDHTPHFQHESGRLPSTKQKTPHCTKHTIELKQHLALVSACPALTPWFTLSRGWEPVVDGFEHIKPGSSRGITKPWANPRNHLATWSDICWVVTSCFHKHALKQTNNQKTKYSKSFPFHWQK